MERIEGLIKIHIRRKQFQKSAPIIVGLEEAECGIQVVSAGIKKINAKTNPLKKIEWEGQKQLGRSGKHDASAVLIITKMNFFIICTVCPHNKTL